MPHYIKSCGTLSFVARNITAKLLEVSSLAGGPGVTDSRNASPDLYPDG